jgi:hypothetical protein
VPNREKARRRRVREELCILPPQITCARSFAIESRGNYAVAGATDIRRSLEERCSSTDVTDVSKFNTNRGRTAAAGLVSGAWLRQPGVSNAVVWERVLSKTSECSRETCKAVSLPCRVLRVVPGTL